MGHKCHREGWVCSEGPYPPSLLHRIWTHLDQTVQVVAQGGPARPKMANMGYMDPSQ